jgi:GNAT superfamily N-acetyltransferase
MTEKEFENFMIISMKDQAQGQVQAGSWKAEEAQGNIERLRSQFLPDGVATPNHYFFAIEETSTGAKVGGLWYTIMDEEGNPQVFVMDIQVYDEYRRHGYGSQAFEAMEEKVRKMGITTIALQVFKHNQSARAMYKKLGYVGTDTSLSKKIDL